MTNRCGCGRSSRDCAEDSRNLPAAIALVMAPIGTPYAALLDEDQCLVGVSNAQATLTGLMAAQVPGGAIGALQRVAADAVARALAGDVTAAGHALTIIEIRSHLLGLYP